ncbi:GNAT family N-acetyltransferase [Veronia pacifica]|uniref:N-acetyltransferase domain-containing protein n=1 Tax=Veronia pacifica TaxID=1080227 RepID=A0A1C3EKZ3_9GAMM|nr:GNAT family N-acetyltransferase [Veronia pacifica]ODA33890.1 hypothetical protein A8L45_08695 [Veronia pacifica]
MQAYPMMLDDKNEWALLRHQLWQESVEQHQDDIEEYLCGDSNDIVTAFGVRNTSDKLVGFIELNVRSHAEGVTTKYVPYIEGWFVCENHRSQGYGASLVKEAEQWAKERGFAFIASDSQIDNQHAIHLHKKLGFDEVERTVNFVKPLN